MSIEANELAFAAWTGLWRAQGRILSAVEHELKKEGLAPLAWYDVLLELERAGDGGLRPFELERALLLPQYGLSRLLDRIEREGHIMRRPCPDDRRGQIILITPQGRDLRKRMWPVYARAIRESLTDKLSEEQLESLRDVLGDILAT